MPRRRRRASNVHAALRRGWAKAGEYERLSVAQNDSCAICGAGPNPLRKFDMDHDHRTHRLRGLLCRGCNMRLRKGLTAEWMRGAADYLDRHAS